MVKQLNHLYLNSCALWEKDFDPAGFSWVDFSDQDNGVVAYLRKSAKQKFLCVHHFSPNYHAKYRLHLPNVASLCEVFNSDAAAYGGSGKINIQADIWQSSVEFTLAPLATLIFEVKFL
jgi:1,4-alpha-glucan branching enzyme